MAKPDQEWLNRMYNNRALVPEFADHFRLWTELSGAARLTLPCTLDQPYGDGPNEFLDIFPALSPAGTAGAPVLVFLHGGYWRSLDKADHAFVAPAFVEQGACVVIPNYALCPAVTIPRITLQMVAAVTWVWRNIARHGGDPDRITLVGHSAGGHLAAMLMTCAWNIYANDLPQRLVKNALSISGLYELQSIRQTPFLQESLRLTPSQVKQVSPAWLPPPLAGRGRGALYVVAGGQESPEFLRHQQLIQSAWGRKAVPQSETLPGLNHFSILEALTRPGQRLHELARELVFKRK